MKKANTFFYFCLMLIIGIATKSFLSFDIFYVFVLCLLIIILSAIFWQNKRLRILLIGIVFLFLGALRFDLSQVKINQEWLAGYNNQNIEFLGQVVQEPDEREFNQKITLDNIEKDNQKLKGRVLVTLSKYQKVNYGGKVKVKGKLETPEIIEAQDEWSRDFDYGRYLSLHKIYSVCYRPEQVSIIKKEISGFEKIKNSLINVKQKFKESIDKSLPLPYSGVLNAMLLGYKREIPVEIRDQFSQSGLSHIIAISGLHITILAGIIFYLAMFLGMSRNKAFWPSVIVLFLYVLMIGFRASALRAFIMGVIVMYGLKIGRLSKSLNALIFSAVILLSINPKLLLADIGFQLSFLAVLGIMLFYDKFEKWLKFLPDKAKVRSIVSVTLSAQILTLPLVIYYFNTLAIISPLANLLILPVLPGIMVLGIIMIVLSLIWSSAGVIAGVLVWVILKYVLWMVETLTKIPGAYFKIKSFDFVWLVGFYLIIAGFLFFLRPKKS